MILDSAARRAAPGRAGPRGAAPGRAGGAARAFELLRRANKRGVRVEVSPAT